MATFKVQFKITNVRQRVGVILYNITHNAEKTSVVTGMNLPEIYWNKYKASVVANNQTISYIDRIEADILLLKLIDRRLSDKIKLYNVNEISIRFNANNDEQGFLSYMCMQILKLIQFKKLGTANNYLHTLYSFMDFLDGYNIGIDCLTETLVERYDLYLLNRGLKRNSMSFYMRILRSVYNKAVRQRLVLQTNPFANVYTGVDVTRKRAVQPQILSIISRLDLSDKPALQFARDLFLFSFYARGMAFVDMAFLKKSSISSNVLCYTRRKTGQRLSVKIEPCMQKIIERYNVSDSEFLFPILVSDIYSKSYQQYRKAVNRYNANLKKLSKYAELDVSLTSYVARHSWATMAQNSNVPISVISAALGHTTEQTTRIYLSAIDSSKIDEANSRIISLVDL